ncbi:hypothetical protein [Halobacterium sp. CBA1126]|uniref:hypothetical protein n=1 Tax=Halobacterium TaxID=2239 RepID=UPI0012FB18D7|nr:hypothetical protein [Halobacterium sp. CBA1126]MUV60576.1 hypothetical protein [Halobacterium sp. CBA1126]
MRRRAVLAAVAALAAGSGCLQVVGDGPVEVRVRRATEAAGTHCTLSASFVDAHPALGRVLTSAKTAPEGEWVVADVDRQTGEDLAAALRDRCPRVDAVYHYEGGEYRVRVTDADGDRVTPNGSASSEAIRRGPPEERP